MTSEEIEELKGLAASMGLYDDKNPCKRAVVLGKAIKVLEQEPTTKNDLEVDAISRSDVLKLMQDNWHTHNGDWAMQESMDDIRALPSVTPQEPRWIPVSERLPEAEYGESDSVLVCFENETQDVLYFNGSNWCFPTGEIYIAVNHKNDWHNKVVAWMPLPKAYREVEE